MRVLNFCRSMRRAAKTKPVVRRSRGAAAVSSEELEELAALERRIRSGKEPLVSGEAMLRETLKDLRKIGRA